MSDDDRGVSRPARAGEGSPQELNGETPPAAGGGSTWSPFGTDAPGGTEGRAWDRTGDRAPTEDRRDAPGGGSAFDGSALGGSAFDDAAFDDDASKGKSSRDNASRDAGSDGPREDGPTGQGGSGDGDGGDKDGDEAEEKPEKAGSFWRELPVLIAIALVLALVIKTWVVQAFFIPSQSMENTLLIGDRVLVNKLVYHVRDIKRGDVVVFNGLDSWDEETIAMPEATNPVSRFLQSVASAFGVAPGEKDYIKRVIGLPGDKIACCDSRGRVTINGTPIDEGSYLYPGDAPSASRFGPVTVQPGQLWVMGDHRSVSQDSREHMGDPGGGAVPESRVIGRAFVIVWPVNRMTTLPIPETFEQPALAAAGAASTALPLALGLVGAVPIDLARRRFVRRAKARSGDR